MACSSGSDHRHAHSRPQVRLTPQQGLNISISQVKRSSSRRRHHYVPYKTLLPSRRVCGRLSRENSSIILLATIDYLLSFICFIDAAYVLGARMGCIALTEACSISYCPIPFAEHYNLTPQDERIFPAYFAVFSLIVLPACEITLTLAPLHIPTRPQLSCQMPLRRPTSSLLCCLRLIQAQCCVLTTETPLY